MDALPKSAASVARVTRARAAFDLKGVVAPLTVLRLRSRDLNLIERQLRNKLTQMPQFFLQAPVVLDFGELEGGLGDLSLPALLQALRFCKVVPMGATNLSGTDEEVARSAGLPPVRVGTPRREESAPSASAETIPSSEIGPAPAVQSVPAADPAPPAAAGAPLVVRQAVRSGQVIYARGADLIVLAPVNPGAQIFADGHIHVYSTLRGRAMAGAQGMGEARLFVQKMEAELVAVAGAYLMAEEIPSSLRGKAAQVHLEAGECRISPL